MCLNWTHCHKLCIRSTQRGLNLLIICTGYTGLITATEDVLVIISHLDLRSSISGATAVTDCSWLQMWVTHRPIEVFIIGATCQGVRVYLMASWPWPYHVASWPYPCGLVTVPCGLVTVSWGLVTVTVSWNLVTVTVSCGIVTYPVASWRILWPRDRRTL